MRQHVDAPATIQRWNGRRKEGSARPRAVPTVPKDLSDGVDVYGSLVTREAIDWYVAFVPGLKKQWWHKFVHKTHKHVFAIRPLAGGNWLLVESWWTRLMVVVLPFPDAMRYLRWGDAGDILKIEELIPGKGNQLRGWSNCAVLAAFVLGRRSRSWLPNGLYKELLKQGAAKTDLRSVIKTYCEASVRDAIDRAPYLNDRRPDGPVAKQLFQVGRDIVMAILSPELLRLCKAALNESERFPHAANAFFEGGMLRVVDRVSEILKSASTAGEVRIEDPERAAALLVAMLRGNIHFEAALELRPVPAVEDIEAHTEAVVGLFLAGLPQKSPASG